MNIEKKNINFQDRRGVITDIFVDEPKQHCTIITTNKGCVRGNHYHKKSKQHDFIVSGKFEVYSQDVGSYIIYKTIVEPNDLITWPPNVAHEFIALEDSVMITFVDGVRGGKNYEKDTIRLETPLHEQHQSK